MLQRLHLSKSTCILSGRHYAFVWRLHSRWLTPSILSPHFLEKCQLLCKGKERREIRGRTLTAGAQVATCISGADDCLRGRQFLASAGWGIWVFFCCGVVHALAVPPCASLPSFSKGCKHRILDKISRLGLYSSSHSTGDTNTPAAHLNEPFSSLYFSKLSAVINLYCHAY